MRKDPKASCKANCSSKSVVRESCSRAQITRSAALSFRGTKFMNASSTTCCQGYLRCGTKSRSNMSSNPFCPIRRGDEWRTARICRSKEAEQAGAKNYQQLSNMTTVSLYRRIQAEARCSLRKIKVRSSLLTHFRPPSCLNLDAQVQYKRNPSRCRFTTVLGVTKTRGLLHPDKQVLNATQNSLCRAVNRWRGRCTCRASNC